MGPKASDGRKDRRTVIPPFQTFLDENREVVYRFLSAAVGPVEADDLFQETFIAALRAYPALSHGENLRSWVLTVATRKVIDAARAAKRRPIAMAEVPEPEPEASRREEEPLDRREPLWKAVVGLPAKQRAAVVHRFVLDRSYGEIAATMECSEEAARANVSEAVRKLRERMGGHADALR